MPETRSPTPETGAPQGLLTVGEVAVRAHISVRALHHYDEIGLLIPRVRSRAGYRLYDRADLERLHQVLLFRELGLSLEVIGGLLDAPAGERRDALRMQRQALEHRIGRTEATLRAVDRAIAALERGDTMSETELFEGFEDFDHTEYAEEAEERWGDTDAYRESQRRAGSYTKADWAGIKGESEAIMGRAAALLRDGADPTGTEAMAVAEDHRRHISRWFYDCPRPAHAALADMYEADARFGEYFETRAPGLTRFFSEAVRANANLVQE